VARQRPSILLAAAQPAVEVVLVAASVVVASTAFGAYFGSPRWLLPVLAGAAAGTALGVVAAVRRWPGWAIPPVGIALLFILELYLLHAGRTRYGLPLAPALRATTDGLVSGWARMLSVTLPADVRADLVATPVALAMIACTAGTLLVLRSRAVIALCTPAFVVLLGALAVSAGRGVDETAPTVALLAVLLLLVLVRANRTDPGGSSIRVDEAEAVGADPVAASRHSTLGRVRNGLPGAVVVVALATVGAIWLPIAEGANRADPRDLYQPPVRVVTDLSPLVEVRPQLLRDPVEIFRVRVDTDSEVPVNRIRLAALDRFDGALWTQSGTFVPAGSLLPHDAEALRAGADVVTLDVEVLRKRGPFLPVVGVPVALRGAAAAIDEATGTLVRYDEGEEDSPLTYRLTAHVSTREGLKEAGPPRPADTPDALTSLPDPPDWVVTQATEAAGDETAAWDQLTNLEKRLRERDYSAEGRPGHSYAALERALVEDPNRQAPGHAEQYAAAFAVMARQLGYPARVAVGYLLTSDSLEDEWYVVRSSDAHAWPEVLIEGYGWVTFEPTNKQNDVGPQPRPEPDPPEANELEPEEPVRADGGEGEDGRGQGVTVGSVVRTSAYVVAGLVLAAVAVLAGIVAAKVVRRRHRRQAGTPSDRVVAAWRETTDRLRELGFDVPRWWTALEVVAEVTRSGRAERALDDLATLSLASTAAIFAPEEPTAGAARRAWHLEESIRSALLARISLGRRLVLLVDPTPLLPPGVHHLRLRARRPGQPGATAARSPVGVGS
jgi:hypothetical protein